MINKDKNENVSNNMDDYDMNSYLYYIKINKNNKLEGLKEDSESQILMDLVNSISVDKDDNSMITYLELREYENIGEVEGNILLLKEKKEKENSQRMV